MYYATEGGFFEDYFNSQIFNENIESSLNSFNEISDKIKKEGINQIWPSYIVNSDEFNISEVRSKHDNGLKDQYRRNKWVKTLSKQKIFDKYYKFDLKKDIMLDEKDQHSKDFKINKKGFLKIEIIDSGFGIDEEDFSKLFQKFVQVGDGSQKRLGKGIALWVTNILCKKMDGDLKVRSIKGKGSVFTAFIKCD